MMPSLAALLPKLGVFIATALLGGAVTFVGSAAINPAAPISTAGERPGFVGSDTGDTPVGEAPSTAPALTAFDLVAASGPEAPPTVVPGLSPADLALAANALLDPPPPSWLNPSGFPRITPITQFDGSPFQGANCTLASGAMLARLGFGIVTAGWKLRTLQDDQVGGTGLDDLATALWRGYGVSLKYGLLRPEQLKSLLAAGYGAVIQGDYAQIPEPLKLQRGFAGGHAIYLDGYYDKGPTPAYYVIDPIGRPNRYEGEWWPASIVDAFAEALGGGTHIRAAWAFPPGGSAPDVVGPDIVPLPPSGGDQAAPGQSPGPSAQPAAPSASAGPGTPSSGEPGDVQPAKPVDEPGVAGTATVGGLDVIPSLAFCALEPQPPGCPAGIPGIFQVPPTVTDIRAGPNIALKFVDSDRSNKALVGFTVDAGANSDVVFWEADGTPPDIHHASAIAVLDLSGVSTTIARLDVLASTQYHFQVIAGNDAGGSQSPVGTFTTANGVAAFDVALSAAPNPVFKLGTSFAPYLRLALGGFEEPLLRVAQLASPCAAIVRFGALDFCGDARAAPATETCQRAQVTYELLGVDHSSVLIRAFPATPGVDPSGSVVLSTVLEAEGPAGTGDVSVGCLASGVSYNIALDAVGDDRGILASRFVSVP